MANILNKMLDFVGWETQEVEEEIFDEDDMEQNGQKNEKTAAFPRKNHGKVLNLNNSATTKVVVVTPQNINDAKEICDHLRANRSIVMKVENIETQIALRIVDFLSGAVYSLDGNIQKVSSGILLAAPNSVDILGETKEDLHNKGAFPWAK